MIEPSRDDVVRAIRLRFRGWDGGRGDRMIFEESLGFGADERCGVVIEYDCEEGVGFRETDE